MRNKSKRGGKKVSSEASQLAPAVKIAFSLEIKVAGKPRDKVEVNGKPAVFHLGFWNDKSAYGHAQVDPTTLKGSFDLPLYRGQLDTLKLELLAEFTDSDSGLSKPFPLDSSFACMRQICSGKEVEVSMRDPFVEDNVAKLTMQAEKQVNHLYLQRSAMWDVNAHNRSLEAMSAKLLEDINMNNLHVPAASEPYDSGMTYFSAGGNEALGVEPVQTNYAVLNKYIMSSDRVFPHALLCVNLQQTLFNHGYTMQGALELNDIQFAKLMGSVIGGGTEDAGVQPYESDLTLGEEVTLDFSQDPPVQYRMGTTCTENIGTCMAASQFINRVYPDTLRVEPSGGKYMLKDRNSLELYTEIFSREWPSYVRSLNTDDCETQFYVQQLTARTIALGDMSEEAFKSNCRGYVALSNWTPQCYEGAAKFYARAKYMFVSGKVTVANAIGLAGGASATSASESTSTQDKIDNMKDLNGHCYGLLRYQGEKEGELYVRLLEGTTSSKPYRCHKDTSHYTTHDGKTQLRFDQLLTQLGFSVMCATQVCNQVVGEGGHDGGWSGPRQLACMRRTTMVLPCLHSENLAAGKIYKKMVQSCRGGKHGTLAAPVCIPFYQWTIFVGLQCDNSSVGCMPVDEDEYKDEKRMGAGCRPGELAKRNLKAVNAGLSDDTVKLGQRIFEECMPPLASEATFKKVMDTWTVMAPLSEVNQEAEGLRKKGVPYDTVAAMESPCNPELTPYLYHIKKKLADKFNQINSEASDSDGMFMVVGCTATGVSMVLHVEDRPHILTAMSSMLKAKKDIGWPSSVSLGAKQKHMLR